MRLVDGPGLTSAVEVLVGGEQAKTHSGDGGQTRIDDGALTFWPFNVDGRYAWVDDQGFGAAVGAYFPGLFNQKISGSDGGVCIAPMWLMVPYFQLGADRGRLAFSVGGEVGCGAGAAFGGVDVRVLDHPTWPVSLSPAARFTMPWGRDARSPKDQVPRGDSVEVGAALRVGGLFVQYWFERNEGPIRRFENPAGSTEAQTWHTISVGIDVDFEAMGITKSRPRTR